MTQAVLALGQVRMWRAEMVESLDNYLRSHGMVEVGERVVILSGLPMGVVGKTNNLRVHRFKDLDEH